MAETVLLCADGSDVSTEALAAGLAVLRPDADIVLVTVIEPPDPTLVTGTGIAGGTMSAEAFDELLQGQEAEGKAVISDTVSALGLDHPGTTVLRGTPGPTICEYAAHVSASAIVIGSRGRGGIKRALLGSVSDYVVRSATCPVIVTGHA